MVETLTDFLKNATVLTLLTILITLISILGSIVVLIFARGQRLFYWLVGAATLPLLFGLLSMYVDNRLLDTGMGMFGKLSSEAIAAGRRDARITACIGVGGALVVFLMSEFGLKKSRNRPIRGEQTDE